MAALRIILAVLALMAVWAAAYFHHREYFPLEGAIFAVFGALLLAVYGLARVIVWRVRVRRVKPGGFQVIAPTHGPRP